MTLDLLHALQESGVVPITHVISLPRDVAERNGVASYAGPDVAAFARANGLEFYEARSYGLTDADDVSFFAQSRLDIVLVLGWERLIPQDVLAELGVFACGMHGSSYGLPRGRGRSPMNWALIQGRTRFTTSLFAYKPGMDDGEIIGSRTFELNVHDTIATAQQKNRIVMQTLAEQAWRDLESGAVATHAQPNEPPSYFPKRTPDDSAIDWTRSTREICDLVRAVSAPYPAAFFGSAGTRVSTSDVRPFDDDLFASNVPCGAVLDVSRVSQRVVVKTGDGSVVIHDWPSDVATPARGAVLEGADADAILTAVLARYPDWVALEEREIS